MKKNYDPFRCSIGKMLALLGLQVSITWAATDSLCFAIPLQDERPASESPEADARLPATPERFRDLCERGQVKFEFYDKVIAPRKFPGETRFDFRQTYVFRYRYDIRLVDGQRTAIVKPRLEDLQIACTNKIFLPTTLLGEDFWNKRLVVHEFEHVRLNCDARPRLLAEFLTKQIKRLQQPLEEDAPVDQEKIEEAFAASIQAIRTEVVRIIQANNDYLDELTRHGALQLEDPEAFFGELYTADNLAKYKFAYLDDVRNLLELADYRENE